MTVVGVALVSQILRYPYAGLASVGLIFWGVAMMLPQLVISSRRGPRAVPKLSSVEGFLAADNMVKFPQRTALTIVTLGGALGMMVATAALVDGLRIASTRWLVQAFPFDFAITSNSLMSSLYSQHTVPRALVDQVRKVDGVRRRPPSAPPSPTTTTRTFWSWGSKPSPTWRCTQKRRPLGANVSQPENLSKLRSGKGLFVSENFAYFFNLRAGDTITLKTPSGPHSAVILQTLEDYSWPHGVVIMDFDVWTNLWKDDDITYIGISVQPGVSTDLLRADRGDAQRFVLRVPLHHGGDSPDRPGDPRPDRGGGEHPGVDRDLHWVTGDRQHAADQRDAAVREIGLLRRWG